MQRMLHTAAHLFWALWLGGLVTLFICVVTLFHNDHSLAARTAPQLFHVFERYQLILAAGAILCSIPQRRGVLLTLFVLAAMGAVLSPLLLTPQILELQQAGQTHTDQFAKLHGESMLVYTADAALLLAAGLILPNKSSH